MVQTEDQYFFIHQTILDELNEGTTCFSPSTRAELLAQLNIAFSSSSLLINNINLNDTNLSTQLNFNTDNRNGNDLDTCNIIIVENENENENENEEQSDPEDPMETCVSSPPPLSLPPPPPPPPPSSSSSLPPHSAPVSASTMEEKTIFVNRRVLRAEVSPYQRAFKVRRAVYVFFSFL
jgi:hypothetical protein